MQSIENTQHLQYVIKVLKALHLEEELFFTDLSKNSPYEVQIYRWVNKLFYQGKSTNETIKRMHRVRRLFILKN